MTTRNAIQNPVQFILAGKAVFTLQNENTGNRFTFKVTHAHRQEGNNHGAEERYWVKVLTGSDNTSNYEFLGGIYKNDNHVTFKRHRNSRIGEEALSCKAITWLVNKNGLATLPANVKLYHEGRCGRCGRRLTVPESIITGFGPECAGRI